MIPKEKLPPGFDLDALINNVNVLPCLSDAELSAEQSQLIKMLKVSPDNFIGWGFYSGGGPDIQSTESVRKALESQGLTIRQALKLQELMLTDYDTWESIIREDPTASEVISAAFANIYGFPPEALKAAFRRARNEFDHGTFHLKPFNQSGK